MGGREAWRGGEAGWRKLYIGVDGSGGIVAQALTDGNADDAETGLDLIDAVDGVITNFTADAAYETSAIHEAAGRRDAKCPGPTDQGSDRIAMGKEIGCQRSDDQEGEEGGAPTLEEGVGLRPPGHGRELLPPNKSIPGDRLRARGSGAREAEALITCNVRVV